MAGALDGEKPLLRANAPGAATGAAGLRLPATGRTAAVTGITANRHGNRDVALNARECLLQRNVHVMAEIIAGAIGLATAGAAREFREHLVENIGETATGETAATKTAAKTTTGGIVESRMSHTVIGGAFLRIL